MGYVDTTERGDRPAGWVFSSQYGDPERARAEWLKFNPDREERPGEERSSQAPRGAGSTSRGHRPPALLRARAAPSSQTGRAGQSGPASSIRGRQTPVGREPARSERVEAALRASDRSILELDDQEFEDLMQRFYERRRERRRG